MPRAFVAYRTAPFGTAEFDAMQVAATVLGGGRGSRLYKSLVLDQQLMQPSEAIVESWPSIGGATLTIGDVEIRPVKPCARCPIPSIDQTTGVPGPDPLDILQTYRANPRMEGAVCLGMNCIVTAGAGRELHLGQALETEIAF